MYYDTEASLADAVAALTERARRLEGSNRLENATVGRGGITLDGGSINVVKPDGSLVATIGRLPDGTDGIRSVGSGGSMTFDQLAFGSRQARADSLISLAGTSPYAANTWHYLGPDINNVPVTGGRLTVTVGAQISLSINSITGYMGVRLTGPTNRSAELPTSYGVDWRGSGMGFILGASREITFEGLAPGNYNVSAAYYAATVSSPAGAADISNRTMSVRLT